MAKKSSEEVVVKRVNPYPIKATFMVESQHKPMLILRLEQKGFIAELGEREVKLKDSGTVSFNIPASDTLIASSAQVVKTYSRLRPPTTAQTMGQSKTQYLAEFHFLSLPEAKKAAIQTFIKKIRQR